MIMCDDLYSLLQGSQNPGQTTLGMISLCQRGLNGPPFGLYTMQITCFRSKILKNKKAHTLYKCILKHMRLLSVPMLTDCVVHTRRAAHLHGWPCSDRFGEP